MRCPALLSRIGSSHRRLPFFSLSLCPPRALRGRYDNDLDGAINYNEFVQGLMETDFGPHARTTTTAAVAGDNNELVRLLRYVYIGREIDRGDR